MINTFFEMNAYLATLLKKGNPASVVRLDNTAGYLIDCVFKNSPISTQFLNEEALLQGGVYPNTAEYWIQVVLPLTVKAMYNSDSLGFVDVSGDIKRTSPMKEIFKEKQLFFTEGFLAFDPGVFLGYSKNVWNDSANTENYVPWTEYLKDKNVLVISTHVESIKHQWKNKDLIWGDKVQKINSFNLVDVIRAPYHPSLDDRQPENCNTWEDMVNHTKDLISKYDFDILLSGSTTSSPVFVDHVKSLGKIGIQTGGTIQLYFGIKGSRWSKVPAYSDWLNMFNEHWTYPLPEDRPQKILDHLESFYAYW